MSRFSVLVGLLVVSLIVLITNWPLVAPQLAPLSKLMRELLLLAASYL